MAKQRKQPDLHKRAYRAYLRIRTARGWTEGSEDSLPRMRKIRRIIESELRYLRDWCRKQAREELLDAVGMQEMDAEELAAYQRSLDDSKCDTDAGILAAYLKCQESWPWRGKKE